MPCLLDGSVSIAKDRPKSSPICTRRRIARPQKGSESPDQVSALIISCEVTRRTQGSWSTFIKHNTRRADTPHRRRIPATRPPAPPSDASRPESTALASPTAAMLSVQPAAAIILRSIAIDMVHLLCSAGGIPSLVPRYGPRVLMSISHQQIIKNRTNKRGENFEKYTIDNESNGLRAHAARYKSIAPLSGPEAK